MKNKSLFIPPVQVPPVPSVMISSRGTGPTQNVKTNHKPT